MNQTTEKPRGEFHYFQGKAGQNTLQEPDMHTKTWWIKFYPDAKSVVAIQKLKEPINLGTGNIEGVLNEIKHDDEGDFIWLRRPMSRKWNNIETPLSPPVVLDKEDKPIRDRVGVGSDITVKVQCYKYNKPFAKGQGRAIRLMGVKVDNLIPAEMPELSEEQQHLADGLPEQPKQGW